VDYQCPDIIMSGQLMYIDLFGVCVEVIPETRVESVVVPLAMPAQDFTSSSLITATPISGAVLLFTLYGHALRHYTYLSVETRHCLLLCTMKLV